MAKDNMGVQDSEFTSAGNTVVLYAKELSTMMQQYCSAVQSICHTGIQDQLICSKLSKLANDVANLRAPLEEIAGDAAKNCKNFVDAVDSADQFLY